MNNWVVTISLDILWDTQHRSAVHNKRQNHIPDVVELVQNFLQSLRVHRAGAGNSDLKKHKRVIVNQ